MCWARARDYLEVMNHTRVKWIRSKELRPYTADEHKSNLEDLWNKIRREVTEVALGRTAEESKERVADGRDIGVCTHKFPCVLEVRAKSKNILRISRYENLR